MATGALDLVMLPAQWILGFFGVIKSDFLPLAVHVAAFALAAEAALVFVILLVTGVALRGRILEFLINMALRTLHIEVLAHQFEVCFIVIEAGGFPVFFFMALHAIRAQPALVLVVFFVAGVTG